MKRLIAACVLLFMIVCACFCCNRTIHLHYTRTEQALEKIKQQARQGTPVFTQTFTQDWAEAQLVLAVFINSKDLHEIGRRTAQMEAAGMAGNTDDVLETADEILFMLAHLRDDERISLFTFI